jgi:STE24 endopeptidase
MNEDKATRYHRRRRRTQLLGVLSSAVTLVLIAGSGASAQLADLVSPAGAGTASPGVVRCILSTIAFTCLIAAPLAAARFPFDVYREWTLDRVYGLERVSFSTWLAGYVRGIGVALVLLAAAMLAIRASTLAGVGWWIVAALLLWAGHLAWTLVAPIVLRVFGGLRPLARPHVVERLHGLGRRTGAVLDVHEWRGGDDSRRAHAALGGVGRTQRVILSDTLLESLTVDEIEVVVAHELAHHVHGDVWVSSMWRLAVLVLALAASAAALQSLPLVPDQLAPLSPGQLAALPIIGGVSWIVATALSPIGYAISRRQERRADAFAIEMTGNTDAFLTSMRRLAASNLVEERPSRLSRLLSSHPSIHDRMTAAVGARRSSRIPSTTPNTRSASPKGR